MLGGRAGQHRGIAGARPGSRLTAGALVHQVHALLIPRPPPAVGRVQETLVVVRPAVGAADGLVLLLAVIAAAAALDVER